LALYFVLYCISKAIQKPNLELQLSPHRVFGLTAGIRYMKYLPPILDLMSVMNSVFTAACAVHWRTAGQKMKLFNLSWS